MTKQNAIAEQITAAQKSKKKMLAMLVDPDGLCLDSLGDAVQMATEAGVDYFFVGGSLIMQDQMDECLELIKSHSQVPTILFPASAFQVNAKADAILFLSLISGRNPNLLIGKHVEAAPYIRASNLEVLPTGYMLINGGQATTASYMSGTTPIPNDKASIAVATGLAAQYLGFKHLYLDAGSGAKISVPAEMIRSLRSAVDLPIIVGGGVKTPEQAWEKAQAGADIVVVGNAFENNPKLIPEMVNAIKSFNSRV